MSSTSRIIIAAAIGIATVPATAKAEDPFEMLGETGDYTLVALAETGSGSAAGFLQLGSSAHVYGHIGGRYRIETAAGVIVDGDSHHGSGGSLHGGTVMGSSSQLNEATWEDLYANAAATVAAAQELDASVISGASRNQCTGESSATSSMGSHVLTADRDDEGLSVYEIDGCLYLGSGESLLIEGSPEDRFVIRVTGGMRLERGSAILLDGIPGSAVLFSLEGGGWVGEPWAQITAEDGPAGDGAELSGVFLAPEMYWQLGDGTLMPDTRILAGGVQANIQDMHSTDTITGSPLEDEEDEEGDTGEGDDIGDEPDCSTDDDPDADDPCPWTIGHRLEENGSASTGPNIIAIGDVDRTTGGKGCSAAALGASWFWLIGAGLAVARRRRQV